MIPGQVVQNILQAAYNAYGAAPGSRQILRDIVVLELLFSTGLRVSELCALTEKNFRLEEDLLRLPRMPETGGPLEHMEVEVPRLSLVQMGTIALDEVEIDFPLRLHGVEEEAGRLLVEFPGASTVDESCARVRVRFKGGDPPEAVMKINDTLMNIIP